MPYNKYINDYRLDEIDFHWNLKLLFSYDFECWFQTGIFKFVLWTHFRYSFRIRFYTYFNAKKSIKSYVFCLARWRKITQNSEAGVSLILKRKYFLSNILYYGSVVNVPFYHWSPNNSLDTYLSGWAKNPLSIEEKNMNSIHANYILFQFVIKQLWCLVIELQQFCYNKRSKPVWKQEVNLLWSIE